MKRALLGLLLAGCAHGPSAPAQPHAALNLGSVEGMSDDQNRELEGALCAGLVEGNGSEVTCPEAIRAALEVRRQRMQMTGQDPGGVDPVAEAAAIDHVVTFKAEPADGGFTGHLSLASKSSGKELAHRDYHVATWNDLLLQAEPEAKALVLP